MPKRDDGLYGSFEAARQVGISLERLRYWQRLGILKPVHIYCGCRKYRRFSKKDIQRAVVVKRLVEKDKYSLQGAIEKMKKINS